MQFPLTSLHLCWLALQVLATSALFPFRDSRTDPPRNKSAASRIPKYLMKLFEKRLKMLTGNVNMIRGVFPIKTTRTKRALRLVFDQEYLENEKLWKKDELRLYMNKVRATLSSSKRPYLLKIYDLYSKKLVNQYKLPMENIGWQTIQVTGWRDIAAKRIRHKRVGLKLVLQLGKKRLRIDNTPLRNGKARREPYLVVFSTDGEGGRIDKIPNQSGGVQKANYNNDALPLKWYKRFRTRRVQNKRNDAG